LAARDGSRLQCRMPDAPTLGGRRVVERARAARRRVGPPRVPGSGRVRPPRALASRRVGRPPAGRRRARAARPPPQLDPGYKQGGSVSFHRLREVAPAKAPAGCAEASGKVEAAGVWRRTCRSQGRSCGRQAEMSKDLGDDRRVLDGRNEAETPAAAGTPARRWRTPGASSRPTPTRAASVRRSATEVRHLVTWGSSSRRARGPASQRPPMATRVVSAPARRRLAPPEARARAAVPAV